MIVAVALFVFLLGLSILISDLACEAYERAVRVWQRKAAASMRSTGRVTHGGAAPHEHHAE